MKSLRTILIAVAAFWMGIACSRADDDPFAEKTARPTAKAAESIAKQLADRIAAPAKAEQEGEDAESLLVVRVYEVGTLALIDMPSYPAKKLNDLGDGRSLFAEKNDAFEQTHLQMSDGMSGTGISPVHYGSGCMVPDKNDAIIDTITGIISPNSWSEVGGSSSIKSFGDLIVVSTTAKNHDTIRDLLGQIREHITSRKTVVVETHWLWLTEVQLKKLVPNSSGEVEEKAWENHQKQLTREDSDIIPGYHATIACMNGQTVSMVAGRQRRFIISLIPVVGDNGTAAPTASVPANVGAAESRAVGYQPQSSTVQEGAALQVRPMLCGDDQVIVDFHGRVVEVDIPYEAENSTAKESAKKTAAGNAVQAIAEAVDRPVVNTSRIDTTFRAPLGARTLVGGITASTRPEPDEPNLYVFAKITVRQTPKEK
jgi:hypothetical protein